jgi:VanZ family protein
MAQLPNRLASRARFVVATAIVVAIIVYGSLYPFIFRQPVDGIAPAVSALWESRADRPGRIDFIANVLLYAPFGFCAVLALRRGRGTARRVMLITFVGALLSVSIELTQYFDADRVTDAPDVYANSAGTLLGAVGGALTGGNFRWPLLSEIAANRVPALLLGAWIGYRLFPYVPTLDLHKYWDALKPVILDPSLTRYDLFRYTFIWLTICALIEAIAGPRRIWVLFPLFVGCVLAGQMTIVGTTLSMAEIAGAGSAMIGRVVLGFNARFRTILIALAFCGYVVAERLEPFQFGVTPGPFRWTPFVGFMSGDLAIDVMSFLQKLFLYGGGIWLLVRVGLRLWQAAFLMAAMLFVTSQGERFLPDRSAEISDAILALIIGAIFALIGSRPKDASSGTVGRPRPIGHIDARPTGETPWRPKP